jgi:hypothetical protein
LVVALMLRAMRISSRSRLTLFSFRISVFRLLMEVVI